MEVLEKAKGKIEILEISFGNFETGILTNWAHKIRNKMRPIFGEGWPAT